MMCHWITKKVYYIYIYAISVLIVKNSNGCGRHIKMKSLNSQIDVYFSEINITYDTVQWQLQQRNKATLSKQIWQNYGQLTGFFKRKIYILTSLKYMWNYKVYSHRDKENIFFEVFCLISFAYSLTLFAFAFFFAWCEGAVKNIWWFLGGLDFGKRFNIRANDSISEKI